MTDALDSPGIRFCWCPPMDDPNDPDQHETACAHAAFVEQLRAMEKTPLLKPFRRPAPTNSGCYEASWGWVHVRPGCRCPRN